MIDGLHSLQYQLSPHKSRKVLIQIDSQLNILLLISQYIPQLQSLQGATLLTLHFSAMTAD